MEDPCRVYTLYDSILLHVDASLECGRVRAKIRGPLSYLPGIKGSLEMIDGQIPALAGEKLLLSTWIPPVPSKAFGRLARSRIHSILGIRTPDQVTISITEECPNRCIHCALPDSGNKLRLEPEVVNDLIGQVLELGATLVIFDGGEPTIYKELPELVEAVDDRAISTLFTSGVGFTASLARRLKDAGLYAVNVSLDSPDPDEHDYLRGRVGTFRDAMKAVESALQAELFVDIYVVLRRENMRHLQEFHDLAKRVCAHELTFFEVVPTGRWSGKRNIALTGLDHDALDRFVSRSDAPRIFSVPEALRRFGCFAGRNWMHVTPSGEVYPCACMPQSFGSIFEEPVKKIWQRMSSFPYKGIRKCPMRKA